MFEPLEGVLTGEFVDALADDLNTPAALRIISEYSSAAAGSTFGRGEPVHIAESERRMAAAKLKGSCNLLGIGFKSVRVEVEKDFIAALISSRNAARKAKDFKEADRIRDELAAMGIELKDAKDPKTGELATTWEVAR